MIGLTAIERDVAPSHAVLSTTRDWISDEKLRRTWQALNVGVKRDLGRRPAYVWLREWTTGKSDGIRRTHYHSCWCGCTDDEAAMIAERSLWAFGKRAGATSEKAHGWQRVWDAGGLARYMAGLVGHHLKSGQAPPPGWSGRRIGTSRSPRFYASDPTELRQRASALSRDDALRHSFERAVLESSADGLPEDILDEAVTRRLQEELGRPAPRVMGRAAAYRYLGL